jgi:hypothetical protein
MGTSTASEGDRAPRAASPSEAQGATALGAESRWSSCRRPRPDVFCEKGLAHWEGERRRLRGRNTASQTWTRDGGAGRSEVRPVSDLRIKFDQEEEI